MVAHAGPWSSAGSTPAEAGVILDEGRRVIRMEAAAVAALEARLDASFVAAVRAILQSTGRVIVSGVGKSGIVARKIAATLTSTGTAATFLHPVEALHGDLGIVGPGDIAILLSKSGESDELRGLMEFFGRSGVTRITITARADSSLGRHSDIVLDCGVGEEACPHDLAPTTSTMAALAMGDALAVALLQQRGFGRDDFARLHPGGALGRRLLLRVSDVMVAANYPVLQPEATMRECVVLLAEKRGTVAIVDADGTLIGVVTAGDLTRLMEREESFFDVTVSEVMTRTPKAAHAEQLAAEAVGVMERAGIMALPVTDSDDLLIGLVHLHDLMRAGAV
ncbi:MAG: KpsF/GutQ family sugar-phosphate isomerase [Gemmatimonadetes bacterium]|nr:KpsF/GutQ family sugar-phosphate isomerase [Gemmatimonadota bacterium]